MTIIERIKLAFLVFRTSGERPGIPLSGKLLLAWQRTLRLTDCREEILIQFASNASLHSPEYIRLRESNVDLVSHFQAAQEERDGIAEELLLFVQKQDQLQFEQEKAREDLTEAKKYIEVLEDVADGNNEQLAELMAEERNKKFSKEWNK